MVRGKVKIRAHAKGPGSGTGFQPVDFQPTIMGTEKMVKYSSKYNERDGSGSLDPGGTGFQPVDFQPMDAQPVEFQPMNPWKAADLAATQRNLPHLEAAGATYFVTFRCRSGLEMPPQARTEALSAIRHWDGKRIALDAAVVMPDHVHAMFRIIDGSKLGEIMHSIKSFSANRINKMLNRTGAFWLDENFDHVIRHAEEWDDKFEYIRQNPIKNGLVDSSKGYLYLYPGNHG